MVLLGSMSLKTQPKLCVNCKHFIQSSIKADDGKCELFPIETTDLLVSCKDTKYYNFCYTARIDDDMCGKLAKNYKKKRIPNKK